MNQYQHYFLDEFVEDFQDGRLSRRDFILRAVAVSGGVAAAIGLLKSLGLTEADVAAAQAAPAAVVLNQANPVTVAPDDPEISVLGAEFAGADGATVFGYMALPSTPGVYPGVVVIHENRGLVPHIQDVVRRYAKNGFAAIAPDLVSREGGTEAADSAQVPGFLSGADPWRHADDTVAAGMFLRAQERVHPDAHGISGFCFGGGITWRTAIRDGALAAAVPYYGPPPPLDDATRIKAAVLGLYGELDTRITGSIPDMEAALSTAGVPHDFVVYPGANHAFFNDTGDRYNADAAADAWPRTLAWFHEFLPAAVLA